MNFATKSLSVMVSCGLFVSVALPAAANDFSAAGGEGYAQWLDGQNILVANDTNANGHASVARLTRPGGSIVSVATSDGSSNSRVISLSENNPISMQYCRYNGGTISNCGPWIQGTS